GGLGNNYGAGGNGNDTFTGASGNDTFDGGAGTDRVSYATDTAGVNANLTLGTATGSLIGNDVLIGVENVTAGSGNDTLTGDTNTNNLAGGIGDDTYVVDGAADTITENPSEGADTVRTALSSYTLGNNLEYLVYTGFSSFNGTGNSGANSLVG